MRELRRDPLTGDWVALCTDRVLPGIDDAQPCPFCATGAARSGPIIGAVGEAVSTPNRTPALVVEADATPLGEGRLQGLGAHEVILESLAHRPLHHLPAGGGVDALRLVRDRHRDLWQDRRLVWLGWSRQARRGHPISTVTGAAVVPAAVSKENARGGSVRDVRRVEQQDGLRWVGEVGRAGVWCAFAPGVPFETLIAVESPAAQLALADDDGIHDVAMALRGLTRAFEAALGSWAHDVVLHQAPRGRNGAWYLRVHPVGLFDGPALGGVLPSHPALPEAAASLLRDRFDDAVCDDASARGVRH